MKAILNLIAPLLKLVNNIWESISRGKKNKRKKELSEDIKAGRGKSARSRFSEWVQRTEKKD